MAPKSKSKAAAKKSAGEKRCAAKAAAPKLKGVQTVTQAVGEHAPSSSTATPQKQGRVNKQEKYDQEITAAVTRAMRLKFAHVPKAVLKTAVDEEGTSIEEAVTIEVRRTHGTGLLLAVLVAPNRIIQ